MKDILEIIKMLGSKFIIWFTALLTIVGWSIQHNWSLTRGQSVMDPLNWMFAFVIFIMYIIARWIKIL